MIVVSERDALVAAQDYMDQDNLPMAVEALIMGLAHIPSSLSLRRLLGRLCLKLERWQEAGEAFRIVLRDNPGDPEAGAGLAAVAGKPRESASTPMSFGLGKIRQFIPSRCFSSGKHDPDFLWELIGDALLDEPDLAFCGNAELIARMLEVTPQIEDVAFHLKEKGDTLPDSVQTVFVCELTTLERLRWMERLPRHVRVIDPGILASSPLARELDYAWELSEPHIYPTPVPEIAARPGLDLLIIDCPARNLALMPNGLGYLDNALKKTELAYQILDVDTILYHRFHIRRLFDFGKLVPRPNGEPLPTDPWQAADSALWETGEILPSFEAELLETAEAIAIARPKILGLSVHACNQTFSERLVAEVRRRHPDVVILAGGYNCYHQDIGLRGFPPADYMCIGEADLTIGPLCEALARGERPVDVPGVLSRFDSQGRRFVPAPLAHNLDRLDFPRYEWAPSLDFYRNFNGYQLTPIIASRGCRWSRCTFCAERFYWRIRSAENFCEELEWLISQGCDLFMFNESDLNGLPERLLDICNLIIERGIKVRLTGQLRIHKKSDQAFFDTLAKAGFVALRFGVDAFSEKTLELQMKGYTLKTVADNLTACDRAGIKVNLNWVVGIPGETDQDIDEGIAFLSTVRPSINLVENINPLILCNGSMYWLEPEKHGIRFHVPKEELYELHPRAIPADAWWSENPYLDAAGRVARFERAVRGLDAVGVPLGSWAKRVIQDIRTGRDSARTAKDKFSFGPARG